VRRYAVVIEMACDNYSAYAPDLQGGIATGETVAEAEWEFSQAIRFHIEGLKEDGLRVPPPSALAEYVKVPARGGVSPRAKAARRQGRVPCYSRRTG
jgi:predicted RNase H-like HicB family nuclease